MISISHGCHIHSEHNFDQVLKSNEIFLTKRDCREDSIMAADIETCTGALVDGIQAAGGEPSNIC